MTVYAPSYSVLMQLQATASPTDLPQKDRHAEMAT